MNELHIDGSHGEGGGQILRTTLALAAITGRPVRLTNIRAARPKPGMAAQHLTAARAAAALCKARLTGDALGSQSLTFTPGAPVVAADYLFDVGAARPGGSAGATTLVLQTVLLPLALSGGSSTVSIRGGTHLAWAPPYDYIQDIWLPALAHLGITATSELQSWGWYPVGGGAISAKVQGLGQGLRKDLRPLELLERGSLRSISGRAVAARLPRHIPQRMADRARSVLATIGVPVEIDALIVEAACPGAGLFLVARYQDINCGFSALGEPGKPSESVADEAATALIGHFRAGAAIDLHLADQILLPLSFAAGPSRFSAERLTSHLATNSWVIAQFDVARVHFDPADHETVIVTVTPAHH